MSFPGKMKISLTKAENQGWQFSEIDSTHVRVGQRFEPLAPLSWEDDGDLFDVGMNAIEVFLKCEDQVLVDTVFLGEFTYCSGRAIGGRAPAWIFPEMPLGQVEEEDIPASVRKVVYEAIQGICE